MANCIAIATGLDKSRNKHVTRLGSHGATAEANTWRTFARAHVNADGSGYMEVMRDGLTIQCVTFGPESTDGSHYNKAGAVTSAQGEINVGDQS